MATAFKPAILADQYEAFVIGDKGQTYPLNSADTLDECKGLSAARVPHKGRFFIRHTDALTGKVMLSFYAIKQASKGVRRWQYAESKVVHDLYAEHLFDLAGDGL
jgi:hypothetical protein